MTRPGQPAQLEPASADRDWLSVADLMAYLGISRSAVARLMRHIPHVRAPGVGIRFRKEDVDRYLQNHLVSPVDQTPTARPGRSGMPVARDDDDEVLPGGLTRAELKKAAGF